MNVIKNNELFGNIIETIGKKWMLITVKSESRPERINTMTASWGGIGFLFNKPVAFSFIRPQRYTYEFIENADYLTLSFFSEKYREALNLLGKKSGRDGDKIAQSGLTLVEDDFYASFEQAELVLRCKKLYAQSFSEECLIDQSLLELVYPNKDFHKMYISEILEILSL